MITEMDQLGMDIDWFLTDGKHIGFMASGGGKLPDSVAKSIENHERLVSYFRGLPEISDFVVSPELDGVLIKISGTKSNERYLKDYVSITKRGLYSFDKTLVNNFIDGQYHLVASPIKPLNINELPADILEILLETQYSDKLNSILKLDCRNL
ncbi:hypothetical protein [Chryseobacterium paridis]|uniref:Uncharacterized protein n=1 Tax=Chryseobacterium paridis TaxID=2800328 RepID=A0ABS1FTK6_9FLAO|nr:hypothetical protein [Chryseobacterium paridis]MBK1895594.1 hypothetical protein [Chryseobacterium paridis]